jgi:hypothetical protein
MHRCYDGQHAHVSLRERMLPHTRRCGDRQYDTRVALITEDATNSLVWQWTTQRKHRCGSAQRDTRVPTCVIMTTNHVINASLRRPIKWHSNDGATTMADMAS